MDQTFSFAVIDLFYIHTDKKPLSMRIRIAIVRDVSELFDDKWVEGSEKFAEYSTENSFKSNSYLKFFFKEFCYFRKYFSEDTYY